MTLQNNILEVVVDRYVFPFSKVETKLQHKQMAGVNPGGISRLNISIIWGHRWMTLLAKHTKLQGLTLSIWHTCPSGMLFWKSMCSAKNFACPANICTSHVNLMSIFKKKKKMSISCTLLSTGKICTCPDWKITCPVGHVTTKVYVPWDKIYMPRACSPELINLGIHAKKLI